MEIVKVLAGNKIMVQKPKQIQNVEDKQLKDLLLVKVLSK